MGEIMEFLNQLLNQIVELAILLCEYTGVLVIAVSSVRGIIDYIKGNPQTRLNLAKGMAMGLEFKDPAYCGGAGSAGDIYRGQHHCPEGASDIPDPLGNKE